MRKIVYYVATSLDGFIAGPNDDISGFIPSGNGVKKYQDDLLQFDTVILGRRTYEFGYKYGLRPGTKAYPHMEHYIFSSSLHFENPQVTVCKPDLSIIKKLKEETGSDIYLCGGGEFAGWLLMNEEIDILKINLNPFIQGEGIPLFGGVKKKVKTELIESATYEHGLQIITYKINYK